MKTDNRIDRSERFKHLRYQQTNQQTDGHDLLQKCEDALKNRSVRWTYNQNMVYCCVTSIFVGEANIELTIFSLYFHHRKECKQLQTDKKIGAEFFSRRFSLMQGTILGWIDVELEDDVFLKLMTANFLTVIVQDANNVELIFQTTKI